MNYIASFSGGKDSTAMVLRLMEERRPLDHVVFFDTQLEFGAVYSVVDKVRRIVEDAGIEFMTLRNKDSVWLDMLARPTRTGNYGYGWCGGKCRWITRFKQQELTRFKKSIGGGISYIGIAADETHRMKDDNLYPLVEWDMTESDCLAYCHAHGIYWEEDGVELYSIYRRVSCWCCRYTGLGELRNMYHYQPKYWGWLKGLQHKMPEYPFRLDGKSIFDLEERFRKEDEQMELFEQRRVHQQDEIVSMMI